MKEYLYEYADDIQKAVRTIDPIAIMALQNVMQQVILNKTPILVFGNGGSAALAEHMACDWTKGMAQDMQYFSNVISLTTNVPLISAIANDFSYEQIFSKQIEYTDFDKCLVIAISSSGNSQNIIEGIKSATIKGYTVAALVGFDGGRIVGELLAPGLTLHVQAYNYGLVEDSHSLIMHSVAQYFRLAMSTEPRNVKL